MDLSEGIFDNEKEFYNLAAEYFYNISADEYETIQFDRIVSKSISILLDHDFIPTPYVEIRLELCKDEKKIANYFLYVNEDKEFIDEFLY
ncbi:MULTISPECIES: hypothetical protein [Flavobacterium]|uniref:Uncharacterized protein n=2 Tax=Flavobacterium anhuiense TaxID=459526 RepID=A0AAC9D1Q3_9FLAO|nr:MULTISPECIES: hypothetical protein [Flavobacterium]AOC95128.1 hypothetical protein BB050_02005 [Flavobacterium anhuiense]EJG01323.1 hypothetical protein FF52_09703 [Flavobacterium sp. F52]